MEWVDPVLPDARDSRPRGPWRSAWLRLRRDRWSVVALAALVVVLLVSLFGAAAGYFRGFVDAAVSRFTETVMAFPLLLFLVFASGRISPKLAGVSYSWVLPRGVFSVALLIGVFTSFYPLRLVRAQLLTLRN